MNTNCNCALPAVRKKSNKDNANKGRFFFTCEQRQCNFFMWDPNQSATGQGSSDIIDGTSNSGKNNTSQNRKSNKPSNSKRSQNQPLYANTTYGSRPILTVSFSIHNTDQIAVYSAPIRTDLFRDIKGTYFDNDGKCHLIPRQSYEDALNAARNFSSQGYEIQIREIPKFILSFYKKYKPSTSTDSNAKIEAEMKKKIPSKIFERFMPFQREGVRETIKRNGRVLLGDEMGLGKTIQALAFCSFHTDSWPVLVVCPSSLRLTWKAEIKNWLDVIDDDIQVVLGGKNQIDRFALFIIISYDLMNKMDNITSDWRYKIVVCDECHYLKNKEAKRTKVLQPLVQRADYALLLSGTPALSRPIELYTQINMLFRNYTTYHNFGLRYANGHKENYNRWNYSGSSNLTELHWFLDKSILIRRLKKDVMQQLPTKSRSFIMVDIDPQWKKSLGVLKKQAAALDEKSEAAKFYRGPAQKKYLNDRRSNLTAMYGETGEAKLPAVCQYLNELYENTEQKFIVFAHHRNVLDGLAEYVETKLKSEYIRIDGETSQQSRQALCDHFQATPQCRIAVLSITAAGVGLTLTAADSVIFAELFWNPAQLLQGEDRAHRIGRKGTVSIKYVLADGTLDDQQWPMLQKKLNIIGAGIDGGQGLKIDATQEADYTEKGRELQNEREVMQKYLRSSQPPVTDDGEGLDMFFGQYELADDHIQVSQQQEPIMKDDDFLSGVKKNDSNAPNIQPKIDAIVVDLSSDDKPGDDTQIKKRVTKRKTNGLLKFKNEKTLASKKSNQPKPFPNSINEEDGSVSLAKSYHDVNSDKKSMTSAASDELSLLATDTTKAPIPKKRAADDSTSANNCHDSCITKKRTCDRDNPQVNSRPTGEVVPPHINNKPKISRDSMVVHNWKVPAAALESKILGDPASKLSLKSSMMGAPVTICNSNKNLHDAEIIDDNIPTRTTIEMVESITEINQIEKTQSSDSDDTLCSNSANLLLPPIPEEPQDNYDDDDDEFENIPEDDLAIVMAQIDRIEQDEAMAKRLRESQDL